MSDNVKIENGLSFKIGSNNETLFVTYSPCKDKIELTVDILKERVVASPFAALFLDIHLVLEFLRHYKSAPDEESFEFEIGERRDGSCGIVLSMDKMKAHLSLKPCFGGKEITLEAVKNTLTEKKIVFGIVSDDAIEQTIANGFALNFLIAEGLQPIAGIDTQFISFVAEVNERKPLVDEEGNVDYRELGDIPVIHKDDLVLERVPPVPGIKGFNIFGEIIKPTEGANIPFSRDQKGVHLNPENSDQLLADITGQAVSVPNGMIVLPVLTLKEVNFESGNIRFDGSVIVKGDVIDGMKIFALEDITIGGNVTDATLDCMGTLTITGGVTGNCRLIAKGNIIIGGGAQGGHDIADAHEIVDDTNAATIVSHGSVMLGFAENFYIEAGVDIVIEKYAMNNKMMAGNIIVTGAKNSGKKPSIMGGVTWAMKMVKGTIIGAISGIKTCVHVGSNPHIQKREMAIKSALVKNVKEQGDINKILTFFDSHPEKTNNEMFEKLHHSLSKLIIDEELNNAVLQELRANMVVMDDAKIVAERAVYVGTEIRINGKLWKAQENRSKSVFKKIDSDIIITSR